MSYSNLERGGKIIISCKECGRIFYAMPSRIKSGRCHFCSRVCSSKWKARTYVGRPGHHHPIGARNPNWRPDYHTPKTCPICFEIFIGMGKTCSAKCGHILKGRGMERQNNPFWKGEKVHLMRHYEELMNNKPKICDICGGDHRIFVHHLDGDRTHNVSNNLIYMCQHCHTIFHFLIKHPNYNSFSFDKLIALSKKSVL